MINRHAVETFHFEPGCAEMHDVQIQSRFRAEFIQQHLPQPGELRRLQLKIRIKKQCDPL